jgi:hypothetical protein
MSSLHSGARKDSTQILNEVVNGCLFSQVRKLKIKMPCRLYCQISDFDICRDLCWQMETIVNSMVNVILPPPHTSEHAGSGLSTSPQDRYIRKVGHGTHSLFMFDDVLFHL